MIPLEPKVLPLLPRLLERGEVYLFGLFEREDGKWDILVSSAAGDKDSKETLEFLSRLLVPVLSKDELLSISRIVIVPSRTPPMASLSRAMRVTAGSAVVENSNFFGLQIKRAVLFRCIAPPDVNVSAVPASVLSRK